MNVAEADVSSKRRLWLLYYCIIAKTWTEALCRLHDEFFFFFFFAVGFYVRFNLFTRWYELEQTVTGLNRVRSWAAALSSRLSDSDVLLSGNVDEVSTE